MVPDSVEARDDLRSLLMGMARGKTSFDSFGNEIDIWKEHLCNQFLESGGVFSVWRKQIPLFA